jgi:hypothetical protein
MFRLTEHVVPPSGTILQRGGDYGHPPSEVTSNLPTVSKKTLLILCLTGFLVGAGIALDTHSNPLAGAFLGFLGGLTVGVIPYTSEMLYEAFRAHV